MPRQSARENITSSIHDSSKLGYCPDSHVDIGLSNVELWNNLKTKLNMKIQVDFAAFLLNFADKFYSLYGDEGIKIFRQSDNQKTELFNILTEIKSKGSTNENGDNTICDISVSNLLRDSSSDTVINNPTVPEIEKVDKVTPSQKSNSKVEKFQCVPLDEENNVCSICDETHSTLACPAFKEINNANNGLISTCEQSQLLPSGFHFDTVNYIHGLSVFTDVDIERFTWFGPLKGVTVSEKHIPDDSDMKHIWEVGEGCYLDTKDDATSNWLRYIRPAPSRSVRNMTPVPINGYLHFVTTCIISPGEELMYWIDSSPVWASKKINKTSCGGCNIRFEHTLYYRLHCFIFHEASLSLTVRKYHCKVCSAPVLGKENIIKHALLLHNGKGAYQCPFCNKFFLKLNYLEMHKNYGCSANPQRTRPLCDYCGRKFSQPQKLKVHIKRMHSDLSEVLKEFQCAKCLKVLGSRATLQRHIKEVHETPTLSCEKCSKVFTNKSNLKVHMLTHSGIKPFKCEEKGCNCAFTTKQCLQFHYKKAHGLNEKQIPSIRRSVEYTFNAYSGMLESTSSFDSVSVEMEADETQNENTLTLDTSSEVQPIPCVIKEDGISKKPLNNRLWQSSQHEDTNNEEEENEADSELDVTGDYDNFADGNDSGQESFDSTRLSNEYNDGANIKYISQDEINQIPNLTDQINYAHLNRESNSFRDFYERADTPCDLSKSELRSFDQVYQPFRYPYEQYYPLEPIIVDLSHSSEIHRSIDKVYYPLSPVYIPPKSPLSSYNQYN